MTVTLGKNISALTAQRGLSRSASQLAKSFERLSSGLRINSASDDAAGLAVLAGLDSASRVFAQAIRNVNDGMSVANIAEGALNALKNISMRQLELAEQAANGSYSTQQREAQNTEANALVREYNRIVGSASFNGLSLFDSSAGSLSIQAGIGLSSSLQLVLDDQLKRFAGDGTFAESLSFQQSGTFTTVITGDFNGDGNGDFIEIDKYYGLNEFIGNGDGSFKAPVIVASGPTFAQAADVNGDGRIDLVTSTTGSGNFDVLIGNGDGTFRAGQALGVGGFPGDLVIGDFNGDGAADFLSAIGGSTYVFLNDGTGTFTSVSSFVLTGAIARVEDLNGDGRQDLLTDYGGEIALLTSNGDGTFAAGVTQLIPASPTQFGDFDGDGNTDFIRYDGYVMLGNGNGTFRMGARTMASGRGSGVTGDFNGDGYLDVALQYGNGAQFFFGNGDGTFATGTTLEAASDFQGLYAATQGADGRSYLVMNSYELINGLQFIGTLQVFSGNGAFTSSSKFLDLKTQEGAREALITINGNLDRVDGQLAYIGATSARLGVALSNLQAQRDNFQAAAARISDVDVAAESANMVRETILRDAAAAVLAQANQQPALALALLHD